MTDTLTFQGFVTTGAGRFANELVVPGSREIIIAIRDWPERIEPGTLNIQIALTGFPDNYIEAFGKPSVKCLDSRRFSPDAEFRYDAIKNNTLPPTPEKPDRGNAQIWRATLIKIVSRKEVQCWVLRRIGSGLANVLECVSGIRLRDVMYLENGDEVELILEGRWS